MTGQKTTNAMNVITAPKNCTLSCATVGSQSFWQTSSIAQNTWCYLAAHDDDNAGSDGGHWRWWGLSKSHAWYYRWNERPPPGLIIRPGSPLIYRLSRTSPLLLLLHCFIICWTTQTSSLLFFSLHQYFSLYCFALTLTASFIAHCDGYFFTPSVLLSPLFRTDPGCKFHSTIQWLDGVYQVSACFFLLPLESARSVFVDRAPQPSLDNQSMLEHSLLEHNIYENCTSHSNTYCIHIQYVML